MMTRFELEEMPSGRRTFQLRSFSSTRNTRLASAGGWSKGASKRRKSGPIWATEVELPLINKVIFTCAEWPP